MSTTVILDSRVPEIVDHLEARAEALVEKSTFDVERRAKENVIENGSVDTGHLVNSIEARPEGYSGEISVGASYGVYVELGTGVRGAAYEFPGKPQDVSYDPNWTRGIPKDPMHGFAFLTPAVEAERPGFNAAVGQLFG